MIKALVIKNTGSWYVVRTEDGSIVNCKVKGKFRLNGLRCTNPVAVGDWVEIERRDDGTALIVKICQRSNYIIRKSSNLSKEYQILASNLDAALLVVTLVNPLTSTTFIDRFLATACAYNVPVVLAFNKIDLLTEDDDRQLLDMMCQLYESIGYDTLKLSSKTGEGMADLRSLLKDKTTLVSGNSGVGKTSIINSLVPGACLRVGDVSDVHHTGMHTTTFSEMLDLPFGGAIIDTPGVKGFGTIDFKKSEVSHYFPEIFKTGKECRFGDCSHTHEPGCAVRAAVEKHYISESRYASYLSIMEDEDEDKYRKAF